MNSEAIITSEAKTPALQFSVVCEGSGTDNRGGFLLYGIFSGIKTSVGPEAPEKLPPLPFTFLIINQWTNGVGLYRQYTEVSDPDGESVIRSDETEFYLSTVEKVHRVQEQFTVGFRLPGRYTVQVFLGDERCLEYFFTIDIRRDSMLDE